MDMDNNAGIDYGGGKQARQRDKGEKLGQL